MQWNDTQAFAKGNEVPWRRMPRPRPSEQENICNMKHGSSAPTCGHVLGKKLIQHFIYIYKSHQKFPWNFQRKTLISVSSFSRQRCCKGWKRLRGDAMAPGVLTYPCPTWGCRASCSSWCCCCVHSGASSAKPSAVLSSYHVSSSKKKQCSKTQQAVLKMCCRCGSNSRLQ